MKKEKAPCSKMEKKINHVGEKGKTTKNMKVMDGVKQKPEKRDMFKKDNAKGIKK